MIVSPTGKGTYTIVAGERRWRAAQRAGLTIVPVVIRQVRDDREMLELALVENLQRSDLNPMEEAEAYRTLQENFQLSQEEIAARVGKGRPAVTNTLRLLKLPAAIQDFLRSGRLTAGQVRPLLAITDPERQQELALRALREGLSARSMEELASGKKPGAKSAKGAEEEPRAARGGGRRAPHPEAADPGRDRPARQGRYDPDSLSLGRRADPTLRAHHRTDRTDWRCEMNFRGKSSPGDLSGFLDVGSHFDGELKFEQSFRVDGKVVGKVISDGDLVVGENGEIDGEIHVGRLFVSGLVKGEVHASRRLSIHPHGRVEGTVCSRALVIEEGGVLEGQSSMKSETEERAASETPAAPSAGPPPRWSAGFPRSPDGAPGQRPAGGAGRSS